MRRRERPERIPRSEVLPYHPVGPIRLGYQEAWDLQRALLEARVAGVLPDVLLLVEHPPTITLGRSADPANLLSRPDLLDAEGFTVHEVDRGGDITYHGPGQLTGYPILDLNDHGRDIHRYLRQLEKVLLRCLGSFGIRGERVPGLTGVWVDGAKVAAIGVKLRRWVTMHGFALNVDPDLSHFGHIVPCGISDKPVTSMTRLAPDPRPELEEVARFVALHFEAVFRLSPVETTLDSLREVLGAAA